MALLSGHSTFTTSHSAYWLCAKQKLACWRVMKNQGTLLLVSFHFKTHCYWKATEPIKAKRKTYNATQRDTQEPFLFNKLYALLSLDKFDSHSSWAIFPFFVIILYHFICLLLYNLYWRNHLNLLLNCTLSTKKIGFVIAKERERDR